MQVSFINLTKWALLSGFAFARVATGGARVGACADVNARALALAQKVARKNLFFFFFLFSIFFSLLKFKYFVAESQQSRDFRLPHSEVK